MIHTTHKPKAYMNDVYKPLVFCSLCGREEDEGLDQPCTEKIYCEKVDSVHSKPLTGFVSGLPNS